MATTKTIDFLPDVFQTTANKKFLNATLDQLVTEPNLRKINGYVGRKFAPTFKQSDNYLIEPTADRQNYQLEPCVVSTDNENNIQFLSNYTDLVKQISYYGGVTNNHSRLFSNEAYSFDGLVDFDKLVNFSQYYWIPNGPDPVDVYAGGVDLEQEYVVTRDEQLSAYTISGFGTAQNPDLVLARGGRYTFRVNQPGDGFWIQTTPGLAGTVPGKANTSSRDVFGVEDNGAANGTVVINVPAMDEQDYYVNMPQSEVDIATMLSFTEVQHALVQNLKNGIDGITTQLQGKRIIFVNNDFSDTAWENKGVYAVDKYDADANTSDNRDEDPYDNGPYIASARRTSIWQINIRNIDGNELIELAWIEDIQTESKIVVHSGIDFANVEFYKNLVGNLVRVPLITAPLKQLYYNDGKDQRFYGRITIVDPDNTTINVATDILGKKEYTSINGVVFTNGLKVRFNSAAMPETFANSICYVEGVGTSIRLVKVDELVTPEVLDVESLPFDIYGFSSDFFDQGLNGPLTPDYITINRSSIDVNSWSRSNRWFHSDVITATAKYNKVVPIFDQSMRATRAIIEFDPDLQLFNYGKIGKHVDVLDFTITDAFNEVEGVESNYFKTSSFKDGMTIIFANDNDPIVRNQIYVVHVLVINGATKIHLTELENGNIEQHDSIVPINGCTVSLDDFDLTSKLALNPKARTMKANASIGVTPLDGVLSPNIGLILGYTFRFNGSSWIKSQQKAGVNVAPLFDIFDQDGISFADTSRYVNSSFNGSTVFSYKRGSGANDPVLGFPVSYRNFNNVGDIEFENAFDQDSFNELVNKVTVTTKLNTGTLLKNVNRNTSISTNVWTTLSEKTKQYQIISNTCDGNTSYFEIDILPAEQHIAPNIKVFVNNVMLPQTDFSIVDVGVRKAVLVSAPLILNDKVDILIYSLAASSFGYYEVPQNLDFNPLNENFTSLTLGQFRNHLTVMSSNNKYVKGQVPGASNLRDINVKESGGSILQHSAPIIYSSLFLINNDVNFIDSITYAQHEYQKFKNKFLESATSAINAGIIDPPAAVDFILHNLNEVKNISSPWYYSDMVPYDQNKTVIEYTVLNIELTEYEITSIFDDLQLSNKAILVYRNGEQLLKGIDYSFNQNRPSIIFNAQLEYDDLIKIHIYHNTDGCYIPETPTKLGLYPKFTPEVYTDTTYQHPVTMIRGHDGSLTPRFGDLRDALLLELEKRIYNNIKVTYSHSNFDINDVIPGRFRETDYSIAEFNQIVSRCFLNWVSTSRIDYSTNEWFSSNNPWTWNYSRFRDIGGELLPGFWRGAYKYFYDTDAPHERPWECLGFSEMPSWWVDTYGPAPYTGGNLVLWGDLEQGLIRFGERAGIDARYARRGLSFVIPVTDSGELRPPNEVMTRVSSSNESSGAFAIGAQAPIESAWRNSSAYPFAVQQALSLMVPARYFSQLATISEYAKNVELNQFVQKDTRQRITPLDFVLNVGKTRNAGYTNWIVDYITSYGSEPESKITGYLKTIKTQLGYNAAGFTDKSYLRVLAEQSSPGSTNDSIIVPNENYTIHLHKSTPVDRVVYSAVIIEKTVAGFSVTGYNTENPAFTIIPSDANSNQRTITAGDSTGIIYNNYQSMKVTVPYGYEFHNKQQVVDFLISYERFLKTQGFKFDEFNQSLGELMSWELSAKEFLTWTEQGWAPGNIIIVSPVASSISLDYPGAVVDKISNLPLGSKVLDVGFNIIRPSMFSIVRDGSAFTITSESEITIGLLDINLVQYEHVLVFDNTTLFNDIIYKPELGNRQYRLKLIGNKTASWNGQLSAPGFMFNNAKINSWNPGQDYRKGELVKYKSTTYTALQSVVGSDTFIYSQWQQLDSSSNKSGMLPNFAYNAAKFENMYDVDNQIFDQNINSFSTGLLGHRERKYLSDLSVNLTSQAKFYQGYIRDKGTKDAITALSTATFNNLSGHVQFNEEWAFRVGEYGATENNQYVEVKLDDSTFVYNPIAISFLQPGEVADVETIGVYKNTLYKKTLAFTPEFFATRNADSIYENDIRTAGYVNIDDIDATIFDIQDTTATSLLIPQIYSGFKIWVAKDVNKDWDVYRVDETANTLVEISYALDNLAYFTTLSPHILAVDDIFAVRNFSAEADGFYRVARIEDINTVVVTITSEFEAELIDNPAMSGYGTVFKMQSVRFNSRTEATQYSPINGWKDSDKVWIDNVDSKYAVYSKQSPWEYSLALSSSSDVANANYGQCVVASLDGRIVAVSSPGKTASSVKMLVKTAAGEFVETFNGLPTLSPTATIGSAMALNQNTLAVSINEPKLQNAIAVVTLSHGAAVATDLIYDMSHISNDSVTLVSPGHGYTAKPNVVITNGTVISTNPNAAPNIPLTISSTDAGSGLAIELDGHFIDGTTSGVREIELVTAGSGYTTDDVIVVDVAGANGSGTIATAVTSVIPGSTAPITSIDLVSAGSGYTAKPTVSIQGGGGAVAEIVGQYHVAVTSPVTDVRMTSLGSGYTAKPIATVVGDGNGATVSIIGQFKPEKLSPIVGVSLISPGSGYSTEPAITVTGGGGSGAIVKPIGTLVGGSVITATLIRAGAGYKSKPSVIVSGDAITPAVIEATGVQTTDEFKITGLTVVTAGVGYMTTPTITITGGGLEDETLVLSVTTSGTEGTIGTVGTTESITSPPTTAAAWRVLTDSIPSFSSPTITTFNNMFVAVDNNQGSPIVATSLNGKHWTKRTVFDSSNRGVGLQLGNIVVANNKMYALATQVNTPYNYTPVTNTTVSLVTSTDGVVWVATTTNLPSVALPNKATLTLAHNGSMFAIIQRIAATTTAGSRNVLMTSVDGLAWSNSGDVQGTTIVANGSTFAITNLDFATATSNALAFKFWTSTTNGVTWDERIYSIPVTVDPLVYVNYQLTGFEVVNNKFIAKLSKSAVTSSNVGSTHTYNTSFDYYIVSSANCVTWVSTKIGSGYDNSFTDYVTSNLSHSEFSSKVFTNVAWDGTSYIVSSVTTTGGKANNVQLTTSEQYNMLVSSSLLSSAVWTSAIVPATCKWSTIATIDKKVCVLGVSTGSTLYKPAVLANYSMSGGTAGTVTSTKVTTTKLITYMARSNSFTMQAFQSTGSVTISPTVYTLSGFDIVDAGAGYRTAPLITVNGSSNKATAIATINYELPYYAITGIELLTPGNGYLETPTIQITSTDGSGTGASAVATVNSVHENYEITGINLINAGSGYSAIPNVLITANGPGQGASAKANVTLPVEITSIRIDSPGASYTDAPSVTVSKGAEALSVAATAIAKVDVVRPYIITGVTMINSGQNYVVPPTVTIVPTDGNGANATVKLTTTKRGIGSNIELSDDDNWMFVTSTSAGTVSCFKKGSNNKFTLASTITGLATSSFGKSISVNKDASVLVIGAEKAKVGTTIGAGEVYVYYRSVDQFVLVQTITPPKKMIGGKFGSSVKLRNNNELFIGAPNITDTLYNSGVVYLFTCELFVTPYTLTQEIRKPYTRYKEHFGTAISVDERIDSVLISSAGAYSINATHIDDYDFTLDGVSTSIIDVVKNSGAVYVYDLIRTETPVYTFNQQLSNARTVEGDNFGASIALRDNLAVVGSPFNDAAANNAGKIAIFTNTARETGWKLIRRQTDTVDLDTVSKLYLYSKKSQTILSYLDYIDPAKGKILGQADQDITFKTTFDPAIYNVGTLSTVNVDTGFYWASEQVGKVWWNLDLVSYVAYEQDSVLYRKEYWGRLFPGSIVEVLEWVESDNAPSAYIGSGEPKHADNSAYVMHNIVDPFTGIIQTKYYFWVKNKTTVPDIASRRISVSSIAALIASPETQDIPYAAILKNNSVALYNAESYIHSDDTILHIDYTLQSNANLMHNEYELISEGSANAVLPTKIVNKLVDSLSGSDKFGNTVPDHRINVSQRYGTGIRPRQSMIVNRLEAVKNFCQFVNAVFKTEPVAEEFDISMLYSAELPPAEGATFVNKDTGTEMLMWSVKVDSLSEQSYYDPAKLIAGQRMLVMHDANYNNQWSIYKINPDKSFSLVKTQGFCTPDYWEKIDWYDNSYDYTVKPTYTVATYKDIATLTLKANNSIRVTNNGDGRFAIYRANANATLTLVGIQEGTIRLKDSLWAHSTNSIGFGNDNFDTTKFDINPDIELRIIITAIKDVIFKSTLDGAFNNLFFMLLNYILSEQRMIDWAFKTSFVSILHKLRKLDQFPNYIKDNQSYYEDYINEVKPYRTKIREYIIDYEGLDNADIYPTDFDLPSYYDSDLASWRSPSGEHARDPVLLTTTPRYAAWTANHGYTIQSIQVTSPGIGYTPTPRITVWVDGVQDKTANLEAVVDFYSGKVLKVIIHNPGIKHFKTPTILVEGDGRDKNGNQTCVLYPIMSNQTVRSFDTTLRFDRISYTSDVKQWKSHITLQSSDVVSYNSRAYSVAAKLWKKNATIPAGTVIRIDEVADTDFADAIDSKTTLYFASKTVVTTSKFNIADFDLFTTGAFFVPDQYMLINDADLENAADRAMALYSPTVGMPPKELSRLFDGISYPGNTVDGGHYGRWISTDSSYPSFVKPWTKNSVYVKDDLVSYKDRVYKANAVLWQPNVTLKKGTVVYTEASNTLYTNTQRITTGEVFDVEDFVRWGSGKSFKLSQYQVINDAEIAGYANREAAKNKPAGNMSAEDSARLFARPQQKTAGYEFVESDAIDGVERDTNIQSFYIDAELGVQPSEMVNDGTGPVVITGGAFIDAFSSHAPEELLPGRIYDTLDIQVFTVDLGDAAAGPIGYRISKTMANEAVTAFDITTTDDGLRYPSVIDTTRFDRLRAQPKQWQPHVAYAAYTFVTNHEDGLVYTVLPKDGSGILPPAETFNADNFRKFTVVHPTQFDQKRNAWEFRRISAAASTTLRLPLAISDQSIFVTDVSVLPLPHPQLTQPGVIYIAGEKITYYTVDTETNSLGQIRRGVWGTGAPALHPAGTLVVDAGVEQIIPGDAATTTWLRKGFATQCHGDGLRSSDTEQALFLREKISYLPKLPGEDVQWADPDANVSSFDQDNPIRPFDHVPFDSKILE